MGLPAAARAFSLLELVAIIALIGIITGIAIPRVQNFASASRLSATRMHWQSLENSMLCYYGDWAAFPPDVNNGVPPVGAGIYFAVTDWTVTTPLGGQWDWNNVSGVSGSDGWVPVGPNVSIRHTSMPPTWSDFDRLFDEGSLTDGQFRVYRTNFYIRQLR